MAPMPSPEGPALETPHRQILLATARASLAHGVEHGRALPVKAADYPPVLQAPGATFVTLRIADELRGCIGSCEAVRPLIEDVSHNAYAAGFMDPRFPRLAQHELAGLHIDISMLSPLEPLKCASADELLRRVRPGVDGLLLEEGRHRGTLLPAVWEALPDPEVFLRHLRLKAGLPAKYWSPGLRVYRYTAESISEE